MMDGLVMVLLMGLLLVSLAVQAWLLWRLFLILREQQRQPVSGTSVTCSIGQIPTGVTHITDVREAKLADRLDRDGK